MRISIAVPSLNYGRFLETCLRSIQQQTHADFEVLIADGGSTDDSLAVIEHWTAADPRFRFVSTRDAGQADAVQHAFAASTGDIFAFLNADDCYVTADAFALVLAALRAQPDSAVVSFAGWYLDPEGRRLAPVRLRYHPLDGTHLMRYRTAVLQPATFWRREVQQAIPFRTDFHYAFDVVFFYEAYRRFGWLDRSERIAGYRLHGGNKSLAVRADRVAELARFEALKFGAASQRAAYLRRVASLLRKAEHAGTAAPLMKRALYTAVNAVSYASVYRVPGI